MTIAEMKKQFNCGAKLISDVSKAIAEKKPIPIPGHKKTKPVRDNVILIGLVDAMTRENGAVSDTDLSIILGTSRMSINRVRHDLKYTYKALRHGPVLSGRHITKRLAFCQIHLDDDWSKTMFTDESRFSTSPDCPIMQWVKKGDNIYVETEKFPFSIMVWGGIVGDKKSQLIKCPKRLDAESYVDMLETNRVLDFLRESGDGAVFQQDGAPCHTAKSTRRWFSNKNVTLLDKWPANSPDLSPIEQIWGIAKRFIIQRFGMRTPLANDQLEDAIFEAYQHIEPRTIAILTMSVKYRVRLCFARNGGFVGDALDECCRRARVEFDASTTLQMTTTSQEHTHESESGEREETAVQHNRVTLRLPSFLQSQ
mgnify:CR=1 FL=1